NPAVAGSKDAICLGALYRNQWVDFDGAPKTGVFNVDAPIGQIFAVGASILFDEIGFDQTLDAKLAIAARPRIGAGRLGIGASIGFMQRTLGADYRFNDEGDQSIPIEKESSSLIPDIGAGLYYYTNKFYLGVSATHLTGAEMEFDRFVTTLTRHYYGTAGYTFDLSPTWGLRPSVLVKSDEVEMQVDINATAIYNNRFWGGVSYRLDDAIIGMIGFNLTSDLRFGYSYDFTTSEIGNYSSGTHEVTLGYCFNIKRTPTYYMNRNVRFL
ncbi:MAG: PorP/SprF family type IX secretion system membrane protein, partial [Bacteroidia bacterium]